MDFQLNVVFFERLRIARLSPAGAFGTDQWGPLSIGDLQAVLPSSPPQAKPRSPKCSTGQHATVRGQPSGDWPQLLQDGRLWTRPAGAQPSAVSEEGTAAFLEEWME